MEGDSKIGTPHMLCRRFQSTPSAWRETERIARLETDLAFQSTPSAWRETYAVEKGIVSETISIHSLRMEGDYGLNFEFDIFNYFNPLPPHGGRRSFYKCLCNVTHISIHSLRMEGDIIMSITAIIVIYFNPLPPHGGRQEKLTCGTLASTISIHSLRMEGDHKQEIITYLVEKFQSTPSAWRETWSWYF